MKQGDTPSLLDDFDFDAFINLPLDEVDMGLGALHHIILPITMEPSCTIPAVTSQIRRNHMTLGPQQAPGIAPKEPKKPAKARFSCSHQGCKPKQQSFVPDIWMPSLRKDVSKV
ncbi:hypothetical protein M7I_4719 [Glarea lozoyensis 74030]|uniref:Uncharacterized protein n=1 Tax=Glarea lozoyensis (strain ATCC 74030 / MF5533) TaxID=1104152 RepID=H0EPY1_GLAL7|nr:hypothetical protein M7I_4719 [Glarea lozoyensis 74030]